MAERSFKQEVKKLRLGAGEEFRGEGILAVTKALLQAGVSYVSGYQGEHIDQVRDRRALVAGNIRYPRLQQRLGDGKDAFAAELLPGAEPKLLHLLLE